MGKRAHNRLPDGALTARVRAILGDRYEILVEPVRTSDMITLRCRDHNHTYQICTHDVIYRKTRGCKLCPRSLPRHDFIADSFLTSKCRLRFGELQTGSKPNLKVEICCPIHGEQTALRGNFHKSRWGCPKCGKSFHKTLKLAAHKQYRQQVVADLFYLTKGRYRIDFVEKTTTTTVICGTCPIHGTFKINWSAITQSPGVFGCPQCNKEWASKLGGQTRTLGATDDFNRRACAHNGHLELLTKYNGALREIKVRCRTAGHEFSVLGYRFYERTRIVCQECSGKTGVSAPELQIRRLLDELGVAYEANNRIVLKGKELDIYIPEKQIAIEFNGAYWHSEALASDPQASNNKRLACAALGIRLINICSSTPTHAALKLIMNACAAPLETFDARKCAVGHEPSNSKRIQSFLWRNHVQGGVSNGTSYTLSYKGELVAVMCFSLVSSIRGSRRDPSVQELRRYATVGRVRGGASRLLKAFLNANPECSRVISFSDNSCFTGGLYPQLGFQLVKESKPDYSYTRNGSTVVHKSQFQKQRLCKRGGFDYDPAETEHENCLRNGWYRLWDCGKKKWVLEV